MRLARRSKNGACFGHDGRRCRGAACVELAAVSPGLIILVLGIVDVGQYLNVGQVVSNASREGARVAARQRTPNVSNVQSTVTSYLTGVYPNLSAADIAVTVTDGWGSSISGGDLTTINTGSSISVQVDVQFAPVRWISGLSQLDSRTLTRTTVMRRE